MSQNEEAKQHLIAKFQPIIAKAGGGIFTKKTRERLLGTRGLAGRDRTKSDFWFDVRNRVKNALVDLALFIETSDKDQINQVLTKESLEPVVYALLQYYSIWFGKEPDPNRAEIADMLILLSFRFLKESAKGNITLSHERTMTEAVDLSDFLVSRIKGTPYYTPSEPLGTFTRGRI